MHWADCQSFVAASASPSHHELALDSLPVGIGSMDHAYSPDVQLAFGVDGDVVVDGRDVDVVNALLVDVENDRASLVHYNYSSFLFPFLNND